MRELLTTFESRHKYLESIKTEEQLRDSEFLTLREVEIRLLENLGVILVTQQAILKSMERKC